ncbi:antitoxin VbhA family protein [Herbiconiux sp. SALV-R1]|nr:antitoxin VbhA family protein [Herbiconiux sp. SALV-R1]
MGFADAALGAAGHEVTDPVLRAISRRVAAGEVTGDEAAALVKAQLLGTR